MGGYGGYGGFGGYGAPAQPSAYDEYFKAYSVAVMGGNERSELMYGGKSGFYLLCTSKPTVGSMYSRR